MTEAAVHTEPSRYRITPESQRMIDGAKEALFPLQAKHHRVIGMGFFGSRTRGQEQADSDLDVCVYYNGDGPDKVRKQACRTLLMKPGDFLKT